MNRPVSYIFICLFIISGCTNIFNKDTNEDMPVIGNVNEQDEVVISPSLNTPENYYSTVLQDGKYLHSEAKGLVGSAMYNRVDINHLETGLMELALEKFPKDKYYFQEGQYLEGTVINRWLRRYDPERESHIEGLNPQLPELPDNYEQLEPWERTRAERNRYESEPAYFSHLMEHNYLRKIDTGAFELAGVVLGISLNSVYYYQIEDYGAVYEFALQDEAIKQAGQKLAERVLERVRERGNLSNVPILIVLYKEAARQSIVPGTFIAKTFVEPSASIGKWEALTNEYYFFPSKSASTAYPNDANDFAKFQRSLDGFFNNYIGVVGKANYKNNKIQELTININLQTASKAEVIALTQFVADVLKKSFPPSLTIQIYVTSINGPESIVVRHANEAPFIHIYR